MSLSKIPTPITEMALQSLGKGALFAKLGPLVGAPKDAALALLEFATATPAAETVAAESAESSLVWTGPEVNLSPARTTTAVVLELLQGARNRVLIAGYEFDHGAVLFEALSVAMQEHDVSVSVFLDIRRASTKNTRMDAYLAIHAHNFVSKNWPFGAPLPELYYFPAGVEAGSHKSLHAKCIVVDGESVFVGSANFTKRGHKRNIEVGVCTRDAKLASTIENQFARLVDSGDLKVLPAPTPPKLVVPEETELEELEEIDEVEELDEAELMDLVFAGPPAELQQIFDDQLVPSSLWKFYSYVLDHGFEPPEIGEDIEDGGDVIGTAELLWLEQKVAILMEEQLSCRPALETAGWACFKWHEVYDRKREIFDRLARRG